MNKHTTEDLKGEKVGNGCCSSNARNQDDVVESAMQSIGVSLHTLAVKGASCGGCVGKIERALLSVSGVEKANMNLSTGTATISGDVDTETLIRALENVGFSATKAE